MHRHPWLRLVALAGVAALSGCREREARAAGPVRSHTFGNTLVWTDTFRMNQVIEGVELRGVDSGLSLPNALALGLKVDLDSLPLAFVTDFTLGWVDVRSPATTVALLKLNAIVGVRATVDERDRVTTVGITCALCHATVDNSFAAGIGRRQDWSPNKDIRAGFLLTLSPALHEAVVEHHVDVLSLDFKLWN
jgi:hypothetical protein